MNQPNKYPSVTVLICALNDFKHLFAHRYLLGRYLPRAIRKYGPWWYPGYYPPLATLYWLGYAGVKGRLNLIPYFLVDGIAKTAGWIRGIFESTGNNSKKPKE